MDFSGSIYIWRVLCLRTEGDNMLLLKCSRHASPPRLESACSNATLELHWLPRIAFVLVLLVCAVGNRTEAQAPALSFSTDGGYANGFTGTLGWEFTANSTVSLTDFGFYNNGGTIDISHWVGLWNVSGDLLASGTVGPSASDIAIGYFDYSPTTPYTLQAGDTYVIGTLLASGDSFYYDSSTVTTAASVSYVQTQFDITDTPSLTFPQTTDFPSNGFGYFGPNFEVTLTPEPALTLPLGLAMLGVLHRRRRVGRRVA